MSHRFYWWWSFFVSIVKNNNYKSGWRIIPSFTIELSSKDIDLLYKIQAFFQVGSISTVDWKGHAIYHVSSVKELSEVIIPHFLNYPLLTKKWADFLLFKSIIQKMNSKQHLTIEGLNKIVSIEHQWIEVYLILWEKLF